MRIYFLLFALSLFFISCSSDKITKVGLQPLGAFDQNLVDSVSSSLQRVYGVKTYILNAKPLPKETFINQKSPRYRADKLIKILKNEKPDSLDYIMGLTQKDISCTKKDELGNIKEPASKYTDWGIFGLGFTPGPSCIISTYRLQNNNEKVFIQRVKKVAIHELGHNFGLKHCPTEYCVMRDAVETIKTIDRVGMSLCNKCRRKINPMVGI